MRHEHEPHFDTARSWEIPNSSDPDDMGSEAEWNQEHTNVGALSGTDGTHVLLDWEDEGFHLTDPDDPSSGITFDDDTGYVVPDVDASPEIEAIPGPAAPTDPDEFALRSANEGTTAEPGEMATSRADVLTDPGDLAAGQ